jgi:hypothetical protein
MLLTAPESDGGAKAEASELMELEVGPELEQHVQGAPHVPHLVLKEATVKGKHTVQNPRSNSCTAFFSRGFWA